MQIAYKFEGRLRNHLVICERVRGLGHWEVQTVGSSAVL